MSDIYLLFFYHYHHQYVTLDDIMNLVGNDSHISEENMRKMWGDSTKAVNCTKAHILFDEFLLLMKGQTREAVEGEGVMKGRVAEEKSDGFQTGTKKSILLPSGDRVTVDGRIVETSSLTPTAERPLKTPLMPLTPITSGSDDAMGIEDTPLSMDDDDDLKVPPSPFGLMPSLTPPSSPKRTALDYVSPIASARHKMLSPLMGVDQDKASELPSILPIPKPAKYVRKRSRSFDEKDFKKAEAPLFTSDARRAVALPGRDSAINDKNKSALQVNRQLYRAHRQMRLAVFEASKRFEEQQAEHARNYLLAQEAENNKGPPKIAGLVMRRVENKTASSEEVKKLLETNRKEQQSLMEVASKRGGRGRRTRKKTISDMSGMMGSLSTDDLSNVTEQAAAATDSLPPLPSVIETGQDLDLVRGATVPGEFKKVKDPFGAHGKYANVYDPNKGGVYWL
jgi:hypothetical protein